VAWIGSGTQIVREGSPDPLAAPFCAGNREQPASRGVSGLPVASAARLTGAITLLHAAGPVG